MLNFILGFIACLVIAILWPTVFVVIKAKAIEWGKRLLDAFGRGSAPPMVIALAIALVLTGCASTAIPAREAAAPSWLEMKDGYAQSCIADGGCVPMSQRELRELVNTVAVRAMQMCARSGT